MKWFLIYDSWKFIFKRYWFSDFKTIIFLSVAWGKGQAYSITILNFELGFWLSGKKVFKIKNKRGIRGNEKWELKQQLHLQEKMLNIDMFL